MTTHFITAEIDLQASPVALSEAIATELHQHGEPLRWAVTAVDVTTQTATVEGVVTTADATEDSTPTDSKLAASMQG